MVPGEVTLDGADSGAVFAADDASSVVFGGGACAKVAATSSSAAAAKVSDVALMHALLIAIVDQAGVVRAARAPAGVKKLATHGAARFNFRLVLTVPSLS
jgi:hypothetical protein